MRERSRLAYALLVSILVGLSACTSRAEAPSAGPPSSAPPRSVDVLDLSDCREDVCEAPLEPGRYRATFYGRTLDFEISSPGWVWHYFYNFRFIADQTPTEGLYSSDSINFLVDPRIATRDCEDSVDHRIGHSVDDLVSWLVDARGLVVSEPIAADVGGFSGFRLDLELDPVWERTCFFSEGLPAVPLIVHKARWGAYHLAMIPDVSMRWYVLHTDDGALIIDIDDGPEDLSHEDLLRTATEIVGSFAFSPAP